ncbi:hypothetical protein O181_102361 [Austropuccinia psidii MF-1]|uniref:Uncharacterized protein n=1 Tax=Austropuccinia psidii MF-1 TaxID=1389203 RepID=A0A9Q3JII4_9BASI|nr:hypothetical protein [Austropuccinia psidii MF-1]
MFSALRAGPIFVTQPTLPLNQAVKLCVSIYESLAFKTTNFFLLASMRESDFLFVVNALLDCETYVSMNNRTPHYCDSSSCNPPRFKACYEPLQSGQYLVRNFQKRVDVQTMHSFRVYSVRNLAYAYAGSLPSDGYPPPLPQAICEVGAAVASCAVCASKLP